MKSFLTAVPHTVQNAELSSNLLPQLVQKAILYYPLIIKIWMFFDLILQLETSFVN